MIDKLSNPKTGKDMVVFVCEFKDDIGQFVYVTVDGQLKDFCNVHYRQALEEEFKAKYFQLLKEKRLKELN